MNKDRSHLATVADAGEDVLFPPIEARACGHLAVGRPHRLYWEESGNPDGVPVVFLHGGPGGGCGPMFRRFFDPAFWRIILFDQRGAGRSTPFADVTDNTTQHLVNDIEALREYLEVERWAVFGGSWGSTLALAYAQAHPERVLGLVLRGVFLCTEPEINWFLYGMGPYFFPEAYRAFTEFLPEEERGDLLGAYYARLMDPDPAVHGPAARSWSGFEESCSRLIPSRAPVQPVASAIARTRDAHARRPARPNEPSLALARLEAHYMANRGFMEDGQLMNNMNRLDDIPVTIVQGRYDMVCPIGTADLVARTLKPLALCCGARCRPLGAGARHPPRPDGSHAGPQGHACPVNGAPPLPGRRLSGIGPAMGYVPQRFLRAKVKADFRRGPEVRFTSLLSRVLPRSRVGARSWNEVWGAAEDPGPARIVRTSYAPRRKPARAKKVIIQP